VWLLLEAGLVLLTIHLVSGSTWLHHLIDLAVPIAGLLGAWWLGQEAESRRQKAGGGRLLFAVALGTGIAVLLHKPADWVLLVNNVFPVQALPALLGSGSAMWVVVGLWIGIAVTLLRPTWMPIEHE
jgi:hypothetical protein